MKSFFCFLIGFLVLSGTAGAVDESVNDLSDRLDRMEDALKGVQKKLSNNYVGSAKRPSGDIESVSDDKADVLLLQLQEAEQTLRQLTGEVETVRFKQEELQNRIDRVNADTAVRFSEMEKKLAAAEDKIKKMEEEKNSAEKARKEAEKKKKEQAAAAAKAAKNKEAELKEIYGKKTAKELYDQAFSSIKKKDHKAAQAEFEAFLMLHPKNALAGNAQYWLGESFFARSMYQKAAVAFAEGFKNYRESQKAPDNLFKLGVTMAKMNKKEEACVAFKNFTKEYPKDSDTMKRRLEAEVRKLSCP
ncbi:MAG: tol-pal system protein YbgF [Alphaproteobacteria bacterium]|nr:tol-pal system protein YbgF [Alphaproteobacteria bacterium]